MYSDVADRGPAGYDGPSRPPGPPDLDRDDDRRGGPDSYRARSRSPDSRRDGPPPPRFRRDPPVVGAFLITAPTPSNVLGCFGLSIRTKEEDLEDEFDRIGRVEKVVIVYDQKTGQSRRFGFVTMKEMDDAIKAREALNGIDLQGRKIRVDFSMTQKPHEPTPGEYMGPKRPDRDDRDRRGGGGGYDRGGYGGGSSRSRYDSDRGDRGDRGGYRGGSRYYSSNRDSSRSPPPARRRSHSPGAGRRDSPSYDRS